MEAEEAIHIVGMELQPDEGLLTIRLSDGAILEMAPSAPEAEDLHEGQLLSPQQQVDLGVAAERKATARKAMALLDRRFYSTSRLRLRLSRAGFGQAAIDAVLSQLIDQGLLDDRRYASAYVSDQLLRKPVGRRWLMAKLRSQGLNDEAARHGVDQHLDRETEEEFARKALESRRYSLVEDAAQARAMRFLMSRGFAPDLCRRLVFERVRAEGDNARDADEN